MCTIKRLVEGASEEILQSEMGQIALVLCIPGQEEPSESTSKEIKIHSIAFEENIWKLQGAQQEVSKKSSIS